MTHYKLIQTMLEQFKDGSGSHWQQTHFAKWGKAPLSVTIAGAGAIADSHYRVYDSRIGEDAVLGESWLEIMRGLRGLLNGELGGLDGGTCDKLICDMLRLEGIDSEGV